jgi:hypothetical protein
MTNTVTLKTSSRVHILVPWNSISGSKILDGVKANGVRIENAPAVFLPINRG